jgi:hypothetical protein
MLKLKKHSRKRSPLPSSPWKCERVRVERSGEVRLGIFFPNSAGSRAYHTFDIDRIENVDRLRRELMARGAVLRGTKAEQLDHLQKLVGALPSELKVLTGKPGFRDDCFVLGERTIGAALDKYRWQGMEGEPDIGQSKGDLDGWLQEVGAVAAQSSYASIAVMVALAAPLLSYVRMRLSTPLLPETAVINFSGDSATGKTTSARMVSSVIGDPDALIDWQFTRRGLEEWCERRNDLPLVLDDMEKHTDQEMSLKTALKTVIQVIPGGQSKTISSSVRETFPKLRWSTFGLSTSPRPISELVDGPGRKMTKGQAVRGIDIRVPSADDCGIFDRLQGSLSERLTQATELSKKAEAGVAQHYGVLMPAWQAYLLENDVAARIIKLRDVFVKRLCPHGDAWDGRLAAKFGVFYAAGKIANEAGLLLWRDDWAWTATRHCYKHVLAAMHAEGEHAMGIIKRLHRFADDPAVFPKARVGGNSSVSISREAIGIALALSGKPVLAVRDDRLISLAGGKLPHGRVIEILKRHHVLLKGQGHAKTRQLCVKLCDAGEWITKPRFLVLDRAALAALIAEPVAA